MAFCQKCGRQIGQTDIFCNSCGSPGVVPSYTEQTSPYPVFTGRSTSRKNKMVSVLLSVFLMYWTWLYTYKRDGWQFWLGLVLSSLPVISAAIFLEFYISNVSWLPDNVLINLSYALPTLIWLLAIIDAVRKKQWWYDNY